MGRKEKLIQRFLKLPKDFTFEETITLLGYLGYRIHRPHPGSIMKEWMMKKIYLHLKSKNLI